MSNILWLREEEEEEMDWPVIITEVVAEVAALEQALLPLRLALKL